MTKPEYHELCKAIRCFTADNDPGAWDDGMRILSKLKETHERFQLRHLRPGYFGCKNQKRRREDGRWARSHFPSVQRDAHA